MAEGSEKKSPNEQPQKLVFISVEDGKSESLGLRTEEEIEALVSSEDYERENVGDNRVILKAKEKSAQESPQPVTVKKPKRKAITIENPDGTKNVRRLTPEQLEKLEQDGYTETTETRDDGKEIKVFKKPKEKSAEEKKQEAEEIRAKIQEASANRDAGANEKETPPPIPSKRLWPTPLGITEGDVLKSIKGIKTKVGEIKALDPSDPEYKNYGAGYMELSYLTGENSGQSEKVPFSKIFEKRKNIIIERETGETMDELDEKDGWVKSPRRENVEQEPFNRDKETIRAEIVLEDVKNYIENTVRKDIEVLKNYQDEKEDKLANPKNEKAAELLKEYTEMHGSFIKLAEMYLDGSKGKTIDAAHRLQNLIKEFKFEKKQLANQIKLIHEQNNQPQTPKIEDYIENQVPKNSQEEEKPKTRWGNFSSRILNAFKGREKAPKKDPIEKILKKYGFKGSSDIKYAVRINLPKENEYGQKTGRMAFDTYEDLNNYLAENPNSVVVEDPNIYPYQILYGAEFHDWFNSLKTKKRQKIQTKIDEVFAKTLKPVPIPEKEPEESTKEKEVVQEKPHKETGEKSSTETLEEQMKRVTREYGERARRLDQNN